MSSETTTCGMCGVQSINGPTTIQHVQGCPNAPRRASSSWSAGRSPDQPSGETLSVREMQEINALRSARWMAGSPGWTTLEVAGELAGEVGELANVCKKLRRSEMGVPGNKVSDAELLQQARGEIADVMIVLMLTASKLGIDLQDAVCETFNAKSEQMGFPERFAARSHPGEQSEPPSACPGCPEGWCDGCVPDPSLAPRRHVSGWVKLSEPAASSSGAEAEAPSKRGKAQGVEVAFENLPDDIREALVLNRREEGRCERCGAEAEAPAAWAVCGANGRVHRVTRIESEARNIAERWNENSDAKGYRAEPLYRRSVPAPAGEGTSEADDAKRWRYFRQFLEVMPDDQSGGEYLFIWDDKVEATEGGYAETLVINNTTPRVSDEGEAKT